MSLPPGRRQPGPHPQPQPQHPDAHPARLLRRHHAGVLLADETVKHVRFVLDGRDGRPVLPFEPALFDTEQVVLFTPDESDDSLQLLVNPEEITNWRALEVCDRWQTYHGRPDAAAWAHLTIAGCKERSRVTDGEALLAPNPLLASEPRLCREANAQKPLVVSLAERLTTRPQPEALLVGIDPWGVDLRLRTGLLRVEFAPGTPDARTEEAARAAVGTLLGLPSVAPPA
jgi:hypothetical protein